MMALATSYSKGSREENVLWSLSMCSAHGVVLLPWPAEPLGLGISAQVSPAWLSPGQGQKAPMSFVTRPLQPDLLLPLL
jgi:hypothetical protein